MFTSECIVLLSWELLVVEVVKTKLVGHELDHLLVVASLSFSELIRFLCKLVGLGR